MKKVFFSLAVLCSMALVSCGGNKAAEATDSETVAAIEEVAVAVESTESGVVESAAAVEAAEVAPAAESAK